MNLPSQLEGHWKQHVDTWCSSGLSQNAYCRDHGLRPNQFSYWKRKLMTPTVDQVSTSCTSPSAFIPLTMSGANSTANGLSLRLPNGCEFSGIEAQHLPIVTRLIEVL